MMGNPEYEIGPDFPFDVFMDRNGRLWFVGPRHRDSPKFEWNDHDTEAWEEPDDEMHEAFQEMFDKMKYPAPGMTPEWSFVPSKVTPPCVELSTMKLRRYNPHRLCPFCKAPGEQLIERVSWGGYYEHTTSGLWAYIPFIHTLKCCRVCGEAFPEELNPELKGKYTNE